MKAFGTSIIVKSCKTPEFRALLKKVKAVIEQVHKSPRMRIQFDALQFQMTGTRLKLIKDMPHRCLGTIRLLARFLKLWNVIKDHYYVTEKKYFPLDKEVDILVQSFSLKRPVGDIIRLAQDTSFPAGVEVFLALCRLRSTALCASVALPIFNATIPTYKDSNPPSQSLPQMLLNPIVVQTREMLREAFEKHFIAVTMYSIYTPSDRGVCSVRVRDFVEREKKKGTRSNALGRKRAGSGGRAVDRDSARGRADRRLDAPARHYLTFQCRRAEADPGSHAHARDR